MTELAASISKALIGVGLWDLLGAMNAWWVCLFHQLVLGCWWILAIPWGAWNYLFNLKAWIDVWELITTPSWLVPYTLRQRHLHFENSNYIWYLCMFACVWGAACYPPNPEREDSMTGYIGSLLYAHRGLDTVWVFDFSVMPDSSLMYSRKSTIDVCFFMSI